jgi:hypothetical protein
MFRDIWRFFIDFTNSLVFRLSDVELGWLTRDELKICGKKAIVANIQAVTWKK